MSDEPKAGHWRIEIERIWGWPPQSPLQNAECAVSKIKALGQYRDDVAKESLAELWIIGLHSFVRGRRQLIEHACGLGLNGRAAHPMCDQTHFSDRRVSAEAAHAHRTLFAYLNDDPNSPVKYEMHRVGYLTLPGDDFTGLNFASLAISR